MKEKNVTIPSNHAALRWPRDFSGRGIIRFSGPWTTSQPLARETCQENDAPSGCGALPFRLRLPQHYFTHGLPDASRYSTTNFLVSSSTAVVGSLLVGPMEPFEAVASLPLIPM